MDEAVAWAGAGFSTRAVHAGRVPPVAQQPVSPPIHLSATWGTGRSAELAALLEDEVDGFVYGRYGSPTGSALHAAVASLHGAEAAWSFASGTAAVHTAVEAVRRGGRVLATSELYGGTYALFRRVETTAGWRVDTVDLTRPDAIAETATAEHTVVYAETIANPTTTVLDLAALAAQCGERDLALVVDNTFASPYLCRPLELGATLVVESATKYLGGHGDVVAGVLTGPRALVAAAREVSIEVGTNLGPFEAWLVARGLQTLALRMDRACASAASVAARLAARADVGTVRYPGLVTHPQHPVARRMFAGLGYGAVLAADLGDRDRAERVADACELFTRAASLGGTHSLIIHPASTTHRQLDDEALAAAGIGPGLVRLSVGIEDLGDLLADLEHALEVTRPTPAAPARQGQR